MNKLKNYLYISFLMLVAFSCNASKDNMMSIDNKKFTDDLNTFSELKIFFGHQSVGGNIMDGLKKISSQHPEAKLNIVDELSESFNQEKYITHKYIGENEKPELKVSGFSDIVKNSFNGDLDVAFMKFCYVDFKSDSKMKVEEVFSLYKNEMAKLKELYPNTKFIHVTSPLRTVQKGIKAELKKLLGKTPAGYENNVLRNKFNQLIVEEYQGKEPVFDLARIESTRPDGSVESFDVDGVDYLAVYPGYTYDRGHLNDEGQVYVAKELIKTVADAIK